MFYAFKSKEELAVKLYKQVISTSHGVAISAKLKSTEVIKMLKQVAERRLENNRIDREYYQLLLDICEQGLSGAREDVYRITQDLGRKHDKKTIVKMLKKPFVIPKPFKNESQVTEAEAKEYVRRLKEIIDFV